MGYFGSEKEIRFEGRVFPEKGMPEEEVMSALGKFESIDRQAVPYHSIVHGIQLMEEMDASRIARKANYMFVKNNLLYKELQPGTERMFLEVKQMIKEMLGYPDGVRIRLTSGGSESNYCGINAAYQWFRKENPKARDPEIVVPYSIHGSVSKWCHYTGIKIKRIPLRDDYRADVSAMEKTITKKTFLIAGSAPCWPYGLYDDIEALGSLAEKYGIWLHVDACLGGFFAPFAEQAGHKLPPWDFRIPGVRSISADLHKYGFSCKPLSSIAFRSREWEKFHEYTAADWPDGPYSTEALAGTSTAGSVASAWAVMKYLGREGYVKLAKRSLEVKRRYAEGINSIEGCKVWENDLAPLVFQLPEGIDIFAVIGGLFERKVYCLPGFQPPLLKVQVDPISDETVDRFVEALREVVPLVRDGKITIESVRKYL